MNTGEDLSNSVHDEEYSPKLNDEPKRSLICHALVVEVAEEVAVVVVVVVIVSSKWQVVSGKW